MAKRPGRKRKATTERSKGRIIPAQKPDRGTPEVQQRRAYLAQEGDPNLTGYPLGILWANGGVTEDEHQAGSRLAYWHWAIYGRQSVAAVRYGITEGGGDPRDPESPDYIEWAEGVKAKLCSATAAMDALSRAHRDAVVSICVYEHMPAWMKPGRIPAPSDYREARKFKEAIAALAACLGKSKRSRAA